MNPALYAAIISLTFLFDARRRPHNALAEGGATRKTRSTGERPRLHHDTVSYLHQIPWRLNKEAFAVFIREVCLWQDTLDGACRIKVVGGISQAYIGLAGEVCRNLAES